MPAAAVTGEGLERALSDMRGDLRMVRRVLTDLSAARDVDRRSRDAVTTESSLFAGAGQVES